MKQPQSYRATLNRAANHAGRINWHSAHHAAMARARAFAKANPQPRATYRPPVMEVHTL